MPIVSDRDGLAGLIGDAGAVVVGVVGVADRAAQCVGDLCYAKRGIIGVNRLVA